MFVGVVLRVVFVGDVGLVGFELHDVDAADAALYPVDDQCYQNHVDQRFVAVGIDVPPSPSIKVGSKFVMELWFYGIKSILNKMKSLNPIPLSNRKLFNLC